jgi:hypothetical protein
MSSNYSLNRGGRWAAFGLCTGLIVVVILAIVHVELELRPTHALVNILVACSPGTPRAAVVSALRGGPPRDYGKDEFEARFPKLEYPARGSALFYDSYNAGDVGVRVTDFVVLFDHRQHVVGVFFADEILRLADE